MSKWRGLGTRFEGKGFALRVQRNSEMDEYRVAVWKDGKRDPACDYYTPDRYDAVDTMKSMAKSMGMKEVKRMPEQFTETKRAHEEARLAHERAINAWGLWMWANESQLIMVANLNLRDLAFDAARAATFAAEGLSEMALRPLDEYDNHQRAFAACSAADAATMAVVDALGIEEVLAYHREAASIHWLCTQRAAYRKLAETGSEAPSDRET